MSWKQYRKIEKGEFLLFSTDTASGGGDNTACQVISKTKVDIPLVYHSGETTSAFVPKLARVAEKMYDITGKKPVVCLERNNGGGFLMDSLAGLNLRGKYELFVMPNLGTNREENEGIRYGWSTNSSTRPKMLGDLKEAIEHNVIRIYDREIIAQMLSFVVVQNNVSWKAQAEKGAHDDLVMALAIGWQLFYLCEDPGDNTQDDYSEYENFTQPVLRDKRGFFI